MAIENLLSNQEAADRLRVGYRAFQRMVEYIGLEPALQIGTARFYTTEQVDGLVETVDYYDPDQVAAGNWRPDLKLYFQGQLVEKVSRPNPARRFVHIQCEDRVTWLGGPQTPLWVTRKLSEDRQTRAIEVPYKEVE